MQKNGLLISFTALLVLAACGPTPSGVDSDKPQAPPPGAPAAASAQIHGNLGQVMRGILFPNSNVIFAAQSNDPTKVKPASDPSTATDPLSR